MRGTMLRREALVLSAIFAVSTSTANAQSAGELYSDARFATLREQGAKVVIETYANWCLACRLQGPSLDDALRDPRYADVVVLIVREDTPKWIWKRFHLRNYATLVAFQAGIETGRMNGYGPNDVAELFRSLD